MAVPIMGAMTMMMMPWLSLEKKSCLLMHLTSSNFGCPKILQFYKPCLLNDVIHVSYLFSPDPTIKAIASNNESRDPEDRLACELLISKNVCAQPLPSERGWRKGGS